MNYIIIIMSDFVYFYKNGDIYYKNNLIDNTQSKIYF